MRVRLTIALLTALLLLLAMPAVTFAWSNGTDGGDSFGTHDWVLKEGNRLAKVKDAGWVNLKVALPRTDDPDTIFHDTYYHVYDVWGDSHYGNAPKKVAEYYTKALNARKAGKNDQASKYVGIMAHYYADICNPMHTDQCDAEDAIHSDYELDAQEFTDEPGENSSWAIFNGYTATKDVVAYTKTTAATSHKSYTALVDGYSAEGMSAAVVTITQKSMNRAANGLADLIISLKKKVKGSSTGGGGGGGGGGGNVTVYITETGTKYHRASCRYLSHSKIAISLSKAKAQGYKPCGVCKPPT